MLVRSFYFVILQSFYSKFALETSRAGDTYKTIVVIINKDNIIIA